MNRNHAEGAIAAASVLAQMGAIEPKDADAMGKLLARCGFPFDHIKARAQKVVNELAREAVKAVGEAKDKAERQAGANNPPTINAPSVSSEPEG